MLSVVFTFDLRLELGISCVELEIVVYVVCLLFSRELTTGVDDLTAVELTVLNVLGRTHNGYVNLSATSDNVVPVDEVDVSELTKVEVAVLDGERFASAEEYAAEVSVRVLHLASYGKNRIAEFFGTVLFFAL